MEVTLAYDHTTALVNAPHLSAIDLATNIRRHPVAFRGRVKDPLLLRQLLLAQHACIQNDARGGGTMWMDEEQWLETLDPVITVHHDQIFFEAFSNEGSCYALLTAPMSAFEVEGDTRVGTTNIDFSWDLRDAIQGLRSSRATILNIGGTGVNVTTQAGMVTREHFERKVDVPERWLKGFLQVQGALAMHPYFFSIKPVDLLSVIAFLEENNPPKPPHGMRYELRPNQPISVVLEPWDERFTLRGTHYTGYERTVRLWGRRRLSVLRDVLPYTQRVTVGVLGRGLPHIYICHAGPYKFLIALSGWTANDWAMGSAFDLLSPLGTPNPEQVARVYNYLNEHLAAKREVMAADTGFSQPEIEQALFRLCRAGRAMFDLTTNTYRLRELFAEPLDVDALFVPDPRLLAAQKLLAEDKIEVREGAAQRSSESRLEAIVHDSVDYNVSISVDTNGRLRYGRCECPFFQASLMTKGPCEHILAARLAYDARTFTEEAVEEEEE